jgi:guanylate kinase
VTATTRVPRYGELDGVDYHFLTKGEFERRLAEGGFIESVSYAGASYGTPFSGLAEARDCGDDVILKIEVCGGMAVRACVPGAILVFLAPPSEEDLMSRLSRRDTEDGISREERLRIAREEMQMASHYDYVIRNDRIVRAVDSLRCIIVASRLSVRRPDQRPA